MSDPKYPSFPELRADNTPPDPRLKFCPFCGGPPLLVKPICRWDVAKVECIQCGAIISAAKEECAIENWNRRTNDEAKTPS